MDILSVIGRKKELLAEDIQVLGAELDAETRVSSFLVIGGAGSIGQAVVKEIFQRSPQKLHVVDISENNLVELVRDIRSSMGYIDGDFKTFALDCGTSEFETMFENEGPYDYVLNLSALKHVRSEKDPYTLMRMIDVNILNTMKTIEMAVSAGAKKYFCVSTDKAANPVNMMGASKRVMEMFLLSKGDTIPISTARFANVAFSDGSLPHGFTMRFMKKQPIAAPNDVRRYFVTRKEAGQLCLISTILGKNGDIVFPKLSDELKLTTFSSIAENFLRAQGYEPYLCPSEDIARNNMESFLKDKKWPCCFSPSDTTGEKDFEEFFVPGERVDNERFRSLGVVKNSHSAEAALLDGFISKVNRLKAKGSWTKTEILNLLEDLLPNFLHEEKGKYLDDKM